jgi:hypothetical protein
MKFPLWMELLEYGRWAPSPHNMQPWMLRLTSDADAELFYNPQRLLPGTNPTGTFMAVGFGIFLETMDIAAAAHGMRVQVDFHGVPLDFNATKPMPLANLKLVQRAAGDREEFDRQLILDRRTSRLPYDDVPVSDAVLHELREIARRFGHEFEWSKEDEPVSWVVALNAETMFYDMSDEVARNEVGSWMRFSKSDARRRADGLAAYAMHFPGALMWLFVHANYLFRIPGIYGLVRKLYIRSMKGTRTVAWISGPFDTLPQCYDAGRMMARQWLAMTKHGVYLHPFGSVITNAKAHARMEQRFHNPNRPHPLWLLVRLGHSDLPPQAQRLTVDQLLLD